MKIALIGASGFLGTALAHHLIEFSRYELVLFSRSVGHSAAFKNNQRVRRVNGSVFDANALSDALKGVDVAVYLIHLMESETRDFSEAEAHAAITFASAARRARVSRVVYVGGLGDDGDNLSAHLRSRHRTGDLLRERLPLVIELRASMIIGPGSTAFEIIRTMTNTLPVLAVPGWSATLTQPIGLGDMLSYLQASLTVSVSSHEIVEVGGPAKITYPMLVARYAKFRGRRAIVFAVPFVPRRLAWFWLGRFMGGRDAVIGQAMVDSLHNQMTVTSGRAHQLFPDIVPGKIEDSFQGDLKN